MLGRCLTRVLFGFLFLPAAALFRPPHHAKERDAEGVVIALLPDQRALLKATYRAGPYPDTFYVNPGAKVLVRGAQRLRASRRQAGYSSRRSSARIFTGVELRSLSPQYPARGGGTSLSSTGLVHPHYVMLPCRLRSPAGGTSPYFLCILPFGGFWTRTRALPDDNAIPADTLRPRRYGSCALAMSRADTRHSVDLAHTSRWCERGSGAAHGCSSGRQLGEVRVWQTRVRVRTANVGGGLRRHSGARTERQPKGPDREWAGVAVADPGTPEPLVQRQARRGGRSTVHRHG